MSPSASDIKRFNAMIKKAKAKKAADISYDRLFRSPADMSVSINTANERVQARNRARIEKAQKLAATHNARQVRVLITGKKIKGGCIYVGANNNGDEEDFSHYLKDADDDDVADTDDNNKESYWYDQ